MLKPNLKIKSFFSFFVQNFDLFQILKVNRKSLPAISPNRSWVVSEAFLLTLLRCILITPSFALAQPGFMPPEVNLVKPWQSENFKNQPENFQFLIVADRTGGMRPGIFDQAIGWINQLQPELVISVGDLIDGYTEDTTLIRTEWDEFEKLIQNLEMPFVKVGGNHDLTNARLRAAWQKRFGPTYYHFLYQNTLFLILDTEAPTSGQISPTQVEYFRQILQQYPRVTWTYVFLHQPLWLYSNDNRFSQIETLLQTRGYTVFAGHFHNYVKTVRFHRNYYILATTGGGSSLRGTAFGEFDHVTWVTATANGPRVVLLNLEGFVDEEIVNDANGLQIQTLRDGSWFRIEPVIHSQRTFTTLTIPLKFKNSTNAPLHITGALPPQGELTFSPATIDQMLPAGTPEQTVQVTLASVQPVELAQLKPIGLELTARFEQDRPQALVQPARRTLVIDWKHDCQAQPLPIQIDGNLSDWPPDEFLDCRYPGYVNEDWDWQGMADSWFRFATRYDQKYLYLAIEATDEKMVLEPGKLTPAQDKFFVTLDPREETKRVQEYAFRNLAQAPVLQLEIAPGAMPQQPMLQLSANLKIESACVLVGSQLRAELALPLAWLEKNQPKPWTSFRLNVGYMDQDNPANIKPSTLWWHPTWDRWQNYAGSGTFYRK
ncbi:metallophosphoesterase [candidate division KSB1 bacterium]|nr:metallophosphoesterase [candidate division KSB1 bacterium]